MMVTITRGLLLAGMLAASGAHAQAVLTTVAPPGNSVPVAQTPPPENGDNPEEIAKDAARDLKDSHFYNKPGATRASFNAEWQECRLIARGSRTPGGVYTTVYNPAVISPIAAGVGGGIGAAIGQAIVEGQLRRANRRTCLLTRGWRLVEPPEAERTRLATLTDADRDAYLSQIIGAERVDGTLTQLDNFTSPVEPTFNLAAPLTGPGEVWAGRKTDPAAPISLKPDEALVAIAFRRTIDEAVGRSGVLQLARYDAEKRDLIYQPRDWKKKGDATIYLVSAASANKKAEFELQLLKVTAGDYVVLASGMLGAVVANAYCFGAPTFHVSAGQTIYLGDLVPAVDVPAIGGGTTTTLAVTRNLDNARRVLATKQPQLAQAMVAADVHNRATYGCAAVSMSRWDWPGVPDLPPPTLPPASTR